MREDFYFVHRVNPNLMYHGTLEDNRESYKISWTDERGKSDFTHYSPTDMEKSIDNGDWIIQIV